MFNKDTRFITRGIESDLPDAIKILLWQSIDLQIEQGTPLDYLQIFKFEKVADSVLAIRHEQEQPPRLFVIYTTFMPEFEQVLDKTVYIIDDEEHSTMLFSYEY